MIIITVICSYFHCLYILLVVQVQSISSYYIDYYTLGVCLCADTSFLYFVQSSCLAVPCYCQLG